MKKKIRLFDYPEKLIERRERRLSDQRTAEKESVLTRTPPTNCSIPFVDGLTQAIQRALRPPNIRVVGTSPQWKWSLQKGIKDKHPSDKQPGVIYALSCKDCEKKYSGETARTIEVRTKEHKRNTHFQQVNASAVGAHAILEGHMIDWMRPQILDRSIRTQHQKTKEALWIANYDEEHLLNQDVGRELSPIWIELLSQTRIKKQNA